MTAARTLARGYTVVYGIGVLLLAVSVRYAAFSIGKWLAAAGVVLLVLSSVVLFVTADSWMDEPALPELRHPKE